MQPLLHPTPAVLWVALAPAIFTTRAGATTACPAETIFNEGDCEDEASISEVTLLQRRLHVRKDPDSQEVSRLKARRDTLMDELAHVQAEMIMQEIAASKEKVVPTADDLGQSNPVANDNDAPSTKGDDASEGEIRDPPVEDPESDADKESILTELNARLAAQMVPRLNTEVPELIKERGLDPMGPDQLTDARAANGKLESVAGLSSILVQSLRGEDIKLQNGSVILTLLADSILRQPLTGRLDASGMKADFSLKSVAIDMAFDAITDISSDEWRVTKLDMKSAKFDFQKADVHCLGSGFTARLCNYFLPSFIKQEKKKITKKVSDTILKEMQGHMGELVPITLAKQ